MARLRPPVPTRTSRLGAGMAVALLAGVAGALVLAGCSAGAGQGSTAVPAPSHPTDRPSLGGPDDVTATGVDGAPVGLAYGFGSVWVAVSDTDTVLRLDSQGEIVGQVTVGRTPLRLAVVPRGVWVSEFAAGTVALIDPQSGAVTTRVSVGAQPEGLTTDGTHLWVVLQRDGRLVELDAATGAAVRTVRLPAGGEPRLAGYAPAAPGRRATVWVTDFGGNRVVPVDAVTGRVGTPVPACPAPLALAVAASMLWLGCQNGWLVTVDLTTHRSAEATDLSQLEGAPDAVTVADGAVWTALSTGPVVLRVDPVSKRVAGRRQAGDDGPLVNADVDLVVAADQVWVSSYNGKVVHHIPVADVATP